MSRTLVIVLIGIGIDAPQKTAPYTARVDVKSAGLARWHEVRSGGGHWAMLPARQDECHQIRLRLGLAKSWMRRRASGFRCIAL